MTVYCFTGILHTSHSVSTSCLSVGFIDTWNHAHKLLWVGSAEGLVCAVEAELAFGACVCHGRGLCVYSTLYV